MLTVEYDEDSGQVVICFDSEGLRSLQAELDRLSGDDHTHLMTPSWGGNELSETSFWERTKLIHHLRLVRRESEW